jgi:nucleotide-binding universal stress UspA family protein
MHIRKILVALDGSAHSDRALALAEDLAGQYGARLELVMVMQPIPALTGDLPVGPTLPTAEDRRAMEVGLEQNAQALRSRGRMVDTHVEVGDPASTLLDLADRLEVDILVAGRSGKGAVARALMGSVTTRLLHQSTRPVCVVP